MMHLGTIGRMVSIKCPTVQRVSPAERYSFITTLGGKIKAQAGPVGRRTWDISSGQLTTPADVGTLMDFVNGKWGSGPFWFVPADAPVVNVLPPAAAACDPKTLTFSGGAQLRGSPPMKLNDTGYAAQSIWSNGRGEVVIGDRVPVVPQQPVTGSAWVIGTGRLRLVFVDANGAQLSIANSEPAGWSTPDRLAVTATAPRNASAVRLVLTGAITQTARPALTWTSTAYEWGDGQGCATAVIHNASRDLTKALDNSRTGRWSEVSFTVQEVG